jgi:hypothetical protein
MRNGCRHILPIIGLILFAAVTFNSVSVNGRVHHHPSKYFYWSGLQLDTDPLDKNRQLERPCQEGEETANCTGWDLLGMWHDPGWLAKASLFSGLPAFVLSFVILMGLGQLGVSQLVSFMVLMPPLLFAWYYFLGWMIDRAINRRFHPG